MKLETLRARSLAIPFRAAFRHASAERSATQTLWVEAVGADAKTGYGEGCPREYVTGESMESAAAFVSQFRREWLDSIRDLETLRAWAGTHGREIDANPAAWCAVELALLDLIGRSEGRTVESLLGQPGLAGHFRYTAVVGDSAPAQFEAQLQQYLKAGFRDFKVKLSGDAERDASKVRALVAAGIAREKVRADANNLWSDAETALHALSALQQAFRALEEPVRAADYAGMARLAAALDVRIVLDESVRGERDLDRLPAAEGVWIVNLRVSKMGGLARSLALLPVLRARGIGLIVGAQVGETSVLARAALTVAAAGRDILVAQEGAFGTHLLARDVVDPPVMFGAGGVLDAAKLPTGAGLGLSVHVDPSDVAGPMP